MKQSRGKKKSLLKPTYTINALKNCLGQIRLDTRWDLNHYMHSMRKGERIVEVTILERT